MAAGRRGDSILGFFGGASRRLLNDFAVLHEKHRLYSVRLRHYNQASCQGKNAFAFLKTRFPTSFASISTHSLLSHKTIK